MQLKYSHNQFQKRQLQAEKVSSEGQVTSGQGKMQFICVSWQIKCPFIANYVKYQIPTWQLSFAEWSSGQKRQKASCEFWAGLACFLRPLASHELELSHTIQVWQVTLMNEWTKHHRIQAMKFVLKGLRLFTNIPKLSTSTHFGWTASSLLAS